MEAIGTQLLFENDQIRVWNLLLEPGQSAGIHQHQYPYIYIVLNKGETLMRESDGNEVRQSDSRWQVVSHEAGLAHELINVGQTPYENIIIEFKGAGVRHERTL